MKKIGLYQYHFRPGQFDFRNNISFINLMYSVLDAAGKHAEENNFGIEDLMNDGKTWILSRINFEYLKIQPKSRNLFIETWVDEIHDVFTDRRFNVMDENKNIFASSCSTWAMIDINSRRFVPLKKHLKLNFIEKNKPILTEVPEKIPEFPENHPSVKTIETQYSDIDINKHVTSTRYIQIFLDSFSLEYHQNHIIKKFEINFLSEVLYGNIISVKKEEISENIFILELIKTSDSKVACRSRISWVQIS